MADDKVRLGEEKKVRLISEREYDRPVSKGDKRENGKKGDPLKEKHVYRPARFQFARLLANQIEEAAKARYALTMDNWTRSMLEASKVNKKAPNNSNRSFKRLSRLVRAAIEGVNEEYRESPALIFNYFLEEAKTIVEMPALWLCLYLEEGQEKLELTEPTYAARIWEMQEKVNDYTARKALYRCSPLQKSRIKWQEGQKAKKEAKERKEAATEELKARMRAEGDSDREIKKKVTFSLNKKDSGVQINLGKGQL